MGCQGASSGKAVRKRRMPMRSWCCHQHMHFVMPALALHNLTGVSQDLTQAVGNDCPLQL
jgi:hypothetical protein